MDAHAFALAVRNEWATMVKEWEQDPCAWPEERFLQRMADLLAQLEEE